MKKIVIGIGFGDEGKGLVVDWLSSKNPEQAVVRYSGGHQVGHCVRHTDKKHIFSNFGSGTLRGLPTIWKAKTCDPMGFINEYQDLANYSPTVWIDPKCPVATPYDKVENKYNSTTRIHGTMGVGFGTTIKREEDNYHLYFSDLEYPEIVKVKLERIKEYYSIHLDEDIISEFLDDCSEMFQLTSEKQAAYSNQIWESSQGIMLDMEYGIFPNVTRSRLGTQGISLYPYDEIYLVTRAYQTRHGNGYCSNQVFKPNVKDETNVYNEFQGEFKTRLLDLDLINYAMKIDSGINNHINKNIVITCLDHMGEYALTMHSKRLDFKNEDEFIAFIIKNIPTVKRVFLSHGPTADDITSYER